MEKLLDAEYVSEKLEKRKYYSGKDAFLRMKRQVERKKRVRMIMWVASAACVAMGLSGGQQQRMCIARALAVEPDVLLMDEPTSALDPASTMRIEELMASLKESYTVVIVTHNMQQAARISDKCAFFLVGDLIEFGETEQVFSMPKDKRTEDYITGRFG